MSKHVYARPTIAIEEVTYESICNTLLPSGQDETNININMNETDWGNVPAEDN